MTTESGLLHGILLEPDDDAPRLVFADWLEETGNPVRAAFIRAQCKLRRLAEDDPARLPLLREEAAYLPQALEALTGKKKPKWLPRMPSAPIQGLGFERGFLARVTTTAGSFLEKADALMQAAPVQHANLTNTKRVVADLAGCSALRRLRSIQLDRVGREGAVSLWQSPFLDGLTRLTLPNSQTTADGAAALANAEALAGLRELNLASSSLFDRGAEALAASRHLTNLQSLDLSNNNIGRRGLTSLAGSPILDQLRELDLSSNRIGDEGTRLLANSNRLGQLISLTVTGNDLSSSAARELLTSPHLKSLVRLSLGCSHLDDVWLIEPAPHLRGRLCLCLSWCPPVGMVARSPLLASCRSLSLSWNHLCDAGVSDLVSVVSELRELRLEHQSITDQGVRVLAESPRLAALRQLSLAYNDISHAGIAVLLQAPFAPHLTHLDLGDIDIGEAGVALLARSPVLENLLMLRVQPRSPALAQELSERFGARFVDASGTRWG